MRIMRRAWGLTVMAAAALLLTSGALSASDGPVVHVKAVVKDGGVRLEAEATGPFEYTTYRPSESLYVLDLSGVSAGDPAGARVVGSDLIKSYRMVTYTSGQKPIVRLEILLSQGVEPQLERRDSKELTLLVARTSGDAHAAPATLTGPAPAISHGTLKTVAAKTSETKASGSTIEAIQHVSLSENDGQTQVNVIGTGKLNYRALRLQNPDRLVLDFAGAHLRTSEKQIASNLDPVREIRLAQFSPEVSRIVIDLRQPAKYNITATDDGVTIEFAGSSAKGAAKAAPQAAPEDVSTTKLVAPIESQPSGVPAPAAILPAGLTQSTSALAAPITAPQPPPQEVVAAKEVVSQPAAAPQFVVASNTSPAPPAITTAPVQPVAADPPKASPVEQAPSSPPSGKYSGEPISVNLKDVDLRDFFRLIHEISGLNIVVDPSVKGSLTIVLDDVPWDQALDIVLKNNDLDKQLDGNVLRIATKDTLKKEADQNRELAKAQAEAADVVTTTRVLSYAKAGDLVATLKKFLSSRGDVLADVRSNTIIIRDIPSVLPVMDNLIRQLDRKSQQVEIEARVVSATPDVLARYRIAVRRRSFRGPRAKHGRRQPAQVGTSPIGRNNPPPLHSDHRVNRAAPPQHQRLPDAADRQTWERPVPTSGFSYLFTSAANFALDYIITAAEQKGVGKLISKPKMVTQNNQTATIKQGTKLPVQTIVNNTVSVQFMDVVLELQVTPQITAEGNVYMDVTVTNDQIDSAIPRVQGIPAIDTQEANSKVLIADGGTIVIGGIIVSSQRTTIHLVPLFGSIPVVGNLFKHTTVSSTSQELLFFLTPRILPN
jgi:type IV pilus assembly protein PilQ